MPKTAENKQSEMKLIQNSEGMTASHTSWFTVNLPIDEALYLFTPEGESLWEPDFNPVYLGPDQHPSTGRFFYTKTDNAAHPETVLWIMSEYCETRKLIRYVRVKPHSDVATIIVELCEFDQEKTRVDVTYHFAALTERGNTYVRSMDKVSYKNWIQEWDIAIRLYLSLRTFDCDDAPSLERSDA